MISYRVDNLQEVIDLLVKWIPLLLPLIIIQLGLWIFALIDVARKRRTRNLNPIIWVLIICFVNMIGPILYFVLGRSDTGVNDDKDNGDDI